MLQGRLGGLSNYTHHIVYEFNILIDLIALFSLVISEAFQLYTDFET
jgi:hypothetical protein